MSSWLAAELLQMDLPILKSDTTEPIVQPEHAAKSQSQRQMDP